MVVQYCQVPKYQRPFPATFQIRNVSLIQERRNGLRNSLHYRDFVSHPWWIARPKRHEWEFCSAHEVDASAREVRVRSVADLTLGAATAFPNNESSRILVVNLVVEMTISRATLG